MNVPMISVILPVYQNQQYLAETISALRGQSFPDFEVICVAGEGQEFPEAAKQDEWFQVFECSCSDAGAAKNLGFSMAQGEYVIFLNCGDICSPCLLEKLLDAIRRHDADIAACNYSSLMPNGTKKEQKAIQTQWLPKDVEAFSYRDCADYIMRIIEPVSWNKLYRAEFLRSHDLKHRENSVLDELAISAVSVAAAKKVACVYESLIQNRVTPVSSYHKLRDAAEAIFDAARQAGKLPHLDKILNSVQTFVVDHFIWTMARAIRDFSAPEAEAIYRTAHEVFNRPEFADVDAKTLRNPNRFREFSTVRKHDYETMKLLTSRRLIVSLTSFPKRIGVVHKALETIYAQTKKPDEIVLWLAEEQFPGKEQDLPESLMSLVRENRLTVRWCDDLKGHKKLLYSLQEYPEDVVVTIDDDLLYAKDMLDALYRSYLLYPNAVSTLRAHLMLLSDDNKILPYKKWMLEVDACVHQPSMQLMSSGGAGDLFPPLGYCKEFFDRDVILKTCLWADNLWSKAMELVSDIPVVLAKPYEPIRCVDGSQEETLYQINGDQNQYDVQMEKISQWMDQNFEPGILVKKLKTDVGVKFWGVEAVSALLDEERKTNRKKRAQAENRVNALEAELKELRSQFRQQETRLAATEEKLQQTSGKLQQTSEKLHRTEESLKKTSRNLDSAQAQIAKLEPLTTTGGQYRDLGRVLQEMKAQRGVSASWCLKYVLYVLAWLPAKFLSAVNGYTRNGLKHTIKSAANQKQN